VQARDGEGRFGRGVPAGACFRQAGLVANETDFETADGAARVIDFMPPRDDGAPQLMRIVQGLRGRVPMRMQLIIRFGYGLTVPGYSACPAASSPRPAPTRCT